MVLNPTYRETVIENIKNTFPSKFTAAGKNKDKVLADDKTIDDITRVFQQQVDIYNIGPMRAYYDAMNQILGVKPVNLVTGF